MSTLPRPRRIKKPKPPKQSESVLQNQIIEYLFLQHRIFAWRNNRVMYFDPLQKRMRYGKGVTQPGQPDILGVIPKEGRLLAIETKGRYESIRAKQETVLGRLDDAGALVMVARSVESFINEYEGRNQ